MIIILIGLMKFVTIGMFFQSSILNLSQILIVGRYTAADSSKNFHQTIRRHIKYLEYLDIYISIISIYLEFCFLDQPWTFHSPFYLNYSLQSQIQNFSFIAKYSSLKSLNILFSDDITNISNILSQMHIIWSPTQSLSLSSPIPAYFSIQLKIHGLLFQNFYCHFQKESKSLPSDKTIILKEAMLPKSLYK